MDIAQVVKKHYIIVQAFLCCQKLKNFSIIINEMILHQL